VQIFGYKYTHGISIKTIIGLRLSKVLRGYAYVRFRVSHICLVNSEAAESWSPVLYVFQFSLIYFDFCLTQFSCRDDELMDDWLWFVSKKETKEA
jgi:hypothetical protein